MASHKIERPGLAGSQSKTRTGPSRIQTWGLATRSHRLERRATAFRFQFYGVQLAIYFEGNLTHSNLSGHLGLNCSLTSFCDARYGGWRKSNSGASAIAKGKGFSASCH